MDRRGRGTSGDAESYDLSQEYQDIEAVAASMAKHGPVDVFAYNISATCALGVAARGAGWPCTSHRARRPARENGGTASAP